MAVLSFPYIPQTQNTRQSNLIMMDPTKSIMHLLVNEWTVDLTADKKMAI